MSLAITILLALGIVFIIWWFWLYQPKAAQFVETGEVNIIVENGVYTPSVIRSAKGKSITLNFLLKDDTPCAKTVIFKDLNISKELQKDKTVSVIITPKTTGSIEFACAMGMYRGTLMVEEATAIDVIIEGGVYNPDVIATKLNEPITLRFTRKDPSPCAEMVIFPDFDLAEEIPFNEPKTITLKPNKKGQFTFQCAMSMYKGKLLVK